MIAGCPRAISSADRRTPTPCTRGANTASTRSDIGVRMKAGKGTRTLDIQLGKLTLYQLSYARKLGKRAILAPGLLASANGIGSRNPLTEPE